MTFSEDFVKSSKKHYKYDHSKINFRDKRSAVNSINEWAAKATDGKLPEITKDVQNPDGAMIVNAMFFKREYHLRPFRGGLRRTPLSFAHVLVFSPQLTGRRDSMIKWWTAVASSLPAHTPLEFQ